MDMWNFLMDCYEDKTLTLEEMEEIMSDDEKKHRLWEEFASEPREFYDYVHDEVKTVYNFLKKKEGKTNGR